MLPVKSKKALAGAAESCFFCVFCLTIRMLISAVLPSRAASRAASGRCCLPCSPSPLPLLPALQPKHSPVLQNSQTYLRLFPPQYRFF